MVFHRVDLYVLLGVFLLAVAAWFLLRRHLRRVHGWHSENKSGPYTLPDTAGSGPARGVGVEVVQGAVTQRQTK